MSLRLVAIAAILAVLLIIVVGLQSMRRSQREIAAPTPSSHEQEQFDLASSAFSAGGSIPVKYTCDGENVRPPLSIRNVPSGTKSLAIVMYDPDAPGGNFVHWLAWNISPETKEIQDGTLPEEVTEGTTSYRSVGYQGPCPPGGSHRYVFRMYALRTILSLGNKTTREDLETAINTYVITQTELIGRYTKP